MKKLILKHVTNGCFWMNFAVFFQVLYFRKNARKSTFSKKTGYFGTYGAFWPFSLAQARTSPKKFCAGLLMWFDVNIVISPSDIKLSEEFASTESVNCLGNKWEDVSVLFCPFVDWTVVLDQL